MSLPAPTRRLHLLVSARSAAEARHCLPHVDILDLKEPQRGPLGAVDAEVLRQVAALCPRRLPLSVALGELGQVDEELVQAIGTLAPLVRFAKVGLAGWARRARWQESLQRLRHRLPSAVELVPAAYADWRQVQAPAPERVLQAACRLGSRTFMLDTALKDGRRLWDHLPPAQVKRLVQRAQDRGCRVVLAGSLRAEDVPVVESLCADVMAVRGAVCREGRDRLDEAHLAAFCNRLQQQAAFSTPGAQFA